MPGFVYTWPYTIRQNQNSLMEVLEMSIRSRSFVSVCLAACVLNIGYGMITPVLPLYANELGMTTMMISMMFSAYALVKLLSNMPGGFLSDVIGARTLLVLVTPLFAVATFLMTINRQPALFSVLRGLEGLADGLAVPAIYAVIVRSIPSKQQGQAIGMLTSFATVGGALGPALGGALVSVWNYNAPFYITSALALVTTLILLVGVQKSETHGDTKLDISLSAAIKDYMKALRPRRSSLLLYGAGVLALFGELTYVSLESMGPLYMSIKLSANPSLVGLFFTINLVVFATFSPLAGHLVDRLGAARLSAQATIGILVVLVLSALALSFTAFLVIFVFEFLLAALLFTSTQTLASGSLAEQKRSGTAFGVMATIRSVGALAGPFLAAVMYEANPRLLFPMVALVGAICLGFFVLLNNQAQRQAQWHPS